jgi:hypothetical protein
MDQKQEKSNLGLTPNSNPNQAQFFFAPYELFSTLIETWMEQKKKEPSFSSTLILEPS